MPPPVVATDVAVHDVYAYFAYLLLAQVPQWRAAISEGKCRPHFKEVGKNKGTSSTKWRSIDCGSARVDAGPLSAKDIKAAGEAVVAASISGVEEKQVSGSGGGPNTGGGGDGAGGGSGTGARHRGGSPDGTGAMLKWLERREQDVLRDGEATSAFLMASKLPQMLSDILDVQRLPFPVVRRLFSLLAAAPVKDPALRHKSDPLYRRPHPCCVVPSSYFASEVRVGEVRSGCFT